MWDALQGLQNQSSLSLLWGKQNLYRLVSTISVFQSILSGRKVPWKNDLENGPFSLFFHNLTIFENLSTHLTKISVMKFLKPKTEMFTSSFFCADRHEIFYIGNIQPYMVQKCPRKWAVFLFFIVSWVLQSLNMFGKNLYDEDLETKDLISIFSWFFFMQIVVRWFLFAISYCFLWVNSLENGK